MKVEEKGVVYFHSREYVRSWLRRSIACTNTLVT
jgi:hypothetical protein